MKYLAASSEVSQKPELALRRKRRGIRPEGTQKVNEVFDRMVKSDVKYRFPIDMASLKAELLPKIWRHNAKAQIRKQ
jgi:hypothetical protein